MAVQLRLLAPSLLLFLTIFTFTSVPASAQEDLGVQDTLEQLRVRSELFVGKLFEARLFEARADMTRTLRRSMTDEAIRMMFGELTTTNGPLLEIGQATVEEQKDGTVHANVPVELSRASVIFNIVFERRGPLAKITSLTMAPIDKAAQLSDPSKTKVRPVPAYVEPSLYKEKTYHMQVGEYSLPSILTMPTYASESLPVPGVVLIGRSGYSDADGDKPPIFRDLARGLATRGIAVLRYAQRGNQYPDLLQSADVDELLVNDALAAVKVLRQQAEVDAESITVLGYGMGANATPLVARIGDAGKAILLSPTPLDTDEYIRETLLYEPEFRQGNMAVLTEEQRALVETTSTLDLTAIRESGLLKPFSSDFWEGYRRLNPARDLEQWEKPYLILFHEGVGYTPKETERAGWTKLASSHPFRSNVVIYDGLIERMGSDERPYYLLAEEVIEDAAEFITARQQNQ